ncbi:MAG: type VI secretion system tip protein VgrG [Pyrinomonadaceae bacterium]|nr:type VI secretion system tip protein VgrG [Sphingobacteriaceae bacterium]
MPAKSPADIADPTLTVVVNVNGSPIKDYYPVVSVSVSHEINRISFAEIVLTDGNVETGDFPISDSEDFVPGNEIEIMAGYGGEARESIFTGVIVKQGIQISAPSVFSLVVTCKHKAVSLTFNKKDESYSEKTDSDIIQAIASKHSITCSVQSTSVEQEFVVQKQATDWDFILSRAEFYGYIITPNKAGLKIAEPALSGSPVLRVAFGDSIIAFEAELNAEHQPPELEAVAWDIKNQVLLKSDASEPSLNGQGNISAKDLSDALSQSKLSLASGTPMAQAELTAWADGRLLRMRLASLTGSVTFNGSAALMPGELIELEGVGARFNGKAFVSAVNHTMEEGHWKTQAVFGLEDHPVYEKENFSYTPAAGQLPAVHGLQIATVKSIFEDPESQFRIQLTIPSNAENQDGVWARVSNFYATANAGAAFLPEVGDEVVVGFLESNPRYPIVLGSLYSTTLASPNPAKDEKNYIKALITKSQLKLSFDDEKKIIKIETPGGNKVTLDDDGKAVELVDQNGNSIKMSSSGIEINSGKDITIKATGGITLDATGKLGLTAAQDVAVSGLNISNTANVGFTAKGNATAELSASGQTTVKGAIVMIN